MDDFPWNEARDAYVLELKGNSGMYRAVVTREFITDELGDGATEEDRQRWLHDNLPHILGAITATETGGSVQEPWSRVLVEEA